MATIGLGITREAKFGARNPGVNGYQGIMPWVSGFQEIGA